MREGWERKTLKEVCQIRPPKREVKNLIGQDDEVSFVPMDILGIDKKYFESKTTKKLSEASSSYTYFQNNDVLLAKITPCFENGKLGIAQGLCNSIGFGSSEYIVYRASEQLSPEFLYYFLNQESFREKGKKVMTGAVGHKRIPKEFYEESQIPIPPLTEQKQIVAILDQAFATIDQAKANIEKNIQNAKELFQSKLNEIFSQKGEGWEEKQLGEVCNLYQGLAINAKTKHLLVEKSSLPLIRIKDLKNNTEEQFVTETGYPENAKVIEDDIIYTRTGSLGLVFRNRKGILHNNSFKVVPSSVLSRDYLFWWLQHEEFTKIIVGLASRAAQPDITHKLFKEQVISVPSLRQQSVYYSQIEGLNECTNTLINRYREKFNGLEELKKSILQKAFAGELTSATLRPTQDGSSVSHENEVVV